jgi:hypothetical protein
MAHPGVSVAARYHSERFEPTGERRLRKYG